MKRPWSNRDGHRKKLPAPPPSTATFEAALEEQRRRHKEAEASTGGSKQSVIAIPGFVYDESTDRYFRATASSSSSSSSQSLVTGSYPSFVDAPHTNNLISMLSDRAISLRHRSKVNELYARSLASLLSLEDSFTWERGTSRFDIDVHPIHGALQVLSHQPAITFYPLPRTSSSKSVAFVSGLARTCELISHGMYGYSSPSWRPYISNSTEVNSLGLMQNIQYQYTVFKHRF
jgi:hypothetical protein